MSTLETALFTRLTGYSGLSALIGRKIYSPPVPQDQAPPYLTYYEVTYVSDHCMGGRTGLYEAHYAFEAWAKTEAEALAIARQAENALDGYSGTSDTIVITFAQLIPSGGPPYDEASGLFRKLREFMIEFRQ